MVDFTYSAAVPTEQDRELLFPFGDGGCFGCSGSNPAGLHLRFFRRGDEVHATYRIPQQFHGAPGIAHGGIVATILDEFSCAAAVFLGEVRVVTGELTVRYEHPVPVEEDLDVTARIVSREHPRYLVIEAQVARSGERLAGSRGKFFSSPIGQTAP